MQRLWTFEELLLAIGVAGNFSLKFYLDICKLFNFLELEYSFLDS